MTPLHIVVPIRLKFDYIMSGYNVFLVKIITIFK